MHDGPRWEERAVVIHDPIYGALAFAGDVTRATYLYITVQYSVVLRCRGKFLIRRR